MADGTEDGRARAAARTRAQRHGLAMDVDRQDILHETALMRRPEEAKQEEERQEASQEEVREETKEAKGKEDII